MSSYWEDAKAYYSTAHWRQLFNSCKIRDGWRCLECGNIAETAEEKQKLHAHHKIPRRPLPYPTALDVLSNLKTICFSCHKLHHPHMENSSKPRIGNKMYRAHKFRRF